MHVEVGDDDLIKGRRRAHGDTPLYSGISNPWKTAQIILRELNCKSFNASKSDIPILPTDKCFSVLLVRGKKWKWERAKDDLVS